MVFHHFNYTFKFLPSPSQILSGLILAQIDQYNSEDFEKVENFNELIKLHLELWVHIFSLAKNTKLDFPLTPEILSNPNHEFVKTLIYIYSMQSFVFSEMNKASRKKDKSKIEWYGPFASALGFIVHCGN